MTTEPQQCPECQGQRMINHPTLFEWRHELSCSLLENEDARKMADADFYQLVRKPTETERVLLSACGIELDADSIVFVDHIQIRVRVRKFYLSDETRVILDPPDEVLRGVHDVPREAPPRIRIPGFGGIFPG